MKKVYAVLMCLLMLALSGTIAFADDKNSKEDILPEWVYLGTERIPSIYNPNGTEVVYGFDRASARVGKSKGEFVFLLAKKTKAQNEIELINVRISKDRKSYRELQTIGFYLDGGFKFAEKLGGDVSKSLTPNTVFYNAFDIWKAGSDAKVEMMDMPKLMDGFNQFELKSGKPHFENWYCFLDDRSSGLDKSNSNLLSVVTYAFNPEERIYSKEISICERTGDTEYRVVKGNGKLYTYEDKLLMERNSLSASSVTPKELDDTASYYYMFYRHKK